MLTINAFQASVFLAASVVLIKTPSSGRQAELTYRQLIRVAAELTFNLDLRRMPIYLFAVPSR